MRRSESLKTAYVNEAPRSKLRGITEHSFEDFSETELNAVASYGEYSSLRYYWELVCVREVRPHSTRPRQEARFPPIDTTLLPIFDLPSISETPV